MTHTHDTKRTIGIKILLGLLQFEDISLRDQDDGIDLALNGNPLNLQVEVSPEEWRHGCLTTYKYLLKNRYVLNRYPLVFLPGTRVDAQLYARIIFLVFKVIYYERLGIDVLLSLHLVFKKVLLPKIRIKANQLAAKANYW